MRYKKTSTKNLKDFKQIYEDLFVSSIERHTTRLYESAIYKRMKKLILHKFKQLIRKTTTIDNKQTSCVGDRAYK